MDNDLQKRHMKLDSGVSNKRKTFDKEIRLNKRRYKQDKDKKVQVDKDQEKAQSEKDSHSKNRGGKKPN